MPDARKKEEPSELDALRKRIQELERAMQRMDAEAEKNLDGYGKFTKDILQSSAMPILGEYVDFESRQFLGYGHFGYAFTCRSRRSGTWSLDGAEPNDSPDAPLVVVKVQGARHTDAVMREWLHGQFCTSHDHTVEYHQVLLHWDRSNDLNRFLAESVNAEGSESSTKYAGDFPSRYFCLIEEYMDGGSIQYLMDQELLDLGGTAAAFRQTASAVAYLHAERITHNDIKPDNILLRILKSERGRTHFQVKLGDFGTAAYSVDRKRDSTLLAYTVHCMATGEKFKKCPAAGAPRSRALEEVRSLPVRGDIPASLPRNIADAMMKLWDESAEPHDIRDARWIKEFELIISDQQESDFHEAARVHIMRSMSHVEMGAVERVRSTACGGIKQMLEEGPSRAQRIREAFGTPDVGDDDEDDDEDDDDEKWAPVDVDEYSSVGDSDVGQEHSGPSAGPARTSWASQQRVKFDIKLEDMSSAGAEKAPASSRPFRRNVDQAPPVQTPLRSPTRREVDPPSSGRVKYGSDGDVTRLFGSAPPQAPVSQTPRAQSARLPQLSSATDSRGRLLEIQPTSPTSPTSMKLRESQSVTPTSPTSSRSPSSTMLQTMVPSSKAEEDNEDLAVKLKTLCNRFPLMSEAIVEKELKAAKGHAGIAASKLRKMNVNN